MATAQDDYAARVRAAGAAYLPLSFFNDRDGVWEFIFENMNYTGASWRGQVRSRPDAPGAPLASLTFAATLVETDTVLKVTLPKAVGEALPAAAEPGTAPQYFYDIAITPAGGIEQTLFAGELYRTGSSTL